MATTTPEIKGAFSEKSTCFRTEVGGREYFFDIRLLDLLNERTFRLPNHDQIAAQAVQWGLTDNNRIRSSLFNYADTFFTKTPAQQAAARALIAQYA